MAAQRSQSSNQGRGSNLSHEDRVAGGRASARSQQRDDRGQFAGSKSSSGKSSSSSSNKSRSSSSGRY